MQTLLGPEPLQGDNAKIVYNQIIVDIKKRIATVLDKMEAGTLKSADNALLPSLYTLNLMSNAQPEAARRQIHAGQINKWKDTYLNWVNKNKRKIPSAYREQFIRNAAELFDELAERGSDLPEDLW